MKPTAYEQALADHDEWNGAHPHPLEYPPLAYYGDPTSPRATAAEAERHAGEIAALSSLLQQLYPDLPPAQARAAAVAAYPLIAGFVVPVPDAAGR